MADRTDGRRPSTTITSATTFTTTTTQGPYITTTTSHVSAAPQARTATPNNASSSTTITHPTVTTSHQFQAPISRAPSPSPAIQAERRPSIRIRRHGAQQDTQPAAQTDWQEGRRMSSSEPQRPQLAAILQPQDDDVEIRRHVSATPLLTLYEEGPAEGSGTAPRQVLPAMLAVPPSSPQRPGWGRQLSSISLRQRAQSGQTAPVAEYESEVVNMLDVIDPEVSTLTTLNNVQNSLFIPNLGWLYNRQPTYDLTQTSSSDSSDEEAGITLGYPKPDSEQDAGEDTRQPAGPAEPGRLARSNTISSVLTSMSDGHNYAVLPHGASLPDWSPEDKAALNDHVRHLLHSRRAKFRRGMRGFGRYVRKPVGFLVTLYAFLLTFWGAAWVLFLIGWLSVGDRQAYFIEICDQILTALFCVVGIGMAPWRAVDTYHMIFVAKYAHLTWRLRKDRGLPALRDRNELPSRPDTNAWEKDQETEPFGEEPVLTAEQQRKLEHHQGKLAKSHTFYKPHETTTHHAFPVKLLIAIVVLLDCHSLFQMALGGTTWGIYYKDRPKALTAVILTCSISCNISAGVLISVGDRKSRKKLVVEQMFRQEVTKEALKKMKKERGLKTKGLGSQRKKKKHGNMIPEEPED